jgi:hypothetical protein
MKLAEVHDEGIMLHSNSSGPRMAFSTEGRITPQAKPDQDRKYLNIESIASRRNSQFTSWPLHTEACTNICSGSSPQNDLNFISPDRVIPSTKPLSQTESCPMVASIETQGCHMFSPAYEATDFDGDGSPHTYVRCFEVTVNPQ